MAKICFICRQELGLLTAKVSFKDGTVCSKCLNIAGIAGISNPRSHTEDDVRSMIYKGRELVKKFSPTKKIDSNVEMDDDNQIMKFGKSVFQYSQIIDYELIEDGSTITKGSLGSAVVGGILAGGVGAIIGGVTGKKKSHDICNSLKVKVTLRNAINPTEEINYISTETKTTSFTYKSAKQNAENCISALQIAIDMANPNNKANTMGATTSAADELLKFKQLLDMGAITEDEFNQKKKQLLNL